MKKRNIIHISDLSDERIKKYIKYNENQLTHIYEPDLGVFIAESAKVIKRALDAGYQPESFLIEEGYLDESSDSVAVREVSEIIELSPEVPIFTASKEVLSNIRGFVVTRGVLSVLRRKEKTKVEDIIASQRRIVILESVVNPTNIGSIFRSAAALGMESIVLTRDCCDPLYRRSARVSMGTVFQIPWTYYDEKNKNYEHYIDQLHDLGYKVVAMALNDQSKDITDPIFEKQDKLAIIMGSEGNGLSEATIKKCDFVIKIPMYHDVDSLNVAAASAVAFWELRVKNK
ncbi:TrmH family RNA methyltransferase [Lachnobacterium bovis]|uniref:tRNA G18 (Ribose-2'-O)-methylase SpoU n=1 Tax=Lachnobacterium bovis TaxID=140626 RepID=A0A1H9S4B8_9FIRM|nr:RNA methyltransferase [Lachnobacterium bovis]SER79906.1 tRNA G18 (ribose-2'-O)-methylase SpoU [Lachnobacterium bovis]